MKQRFSKISGLLLLASTILSTYGCKEETIVKASIAPGDMNLGTEIVSDTFTVITKSFFADALKTSEKLEGLPIIQGLGTIVDPFFGKTNAGLYFQVIPTVNDFSFSAGSYTIDSAVMILPYSGFGWGNRTDPKPQKFTVFRLNEKLDINTDYYSNQDVSLREQVGEATIDLTSVLKTDTVTIAGSKVGFKHLRIPMSQQFVNEVRDNIGTGTFASEGNFLGTFNGFFVMPDSNANTGNNADLLSYILFEGGSDYSRVAIAFYYRENGSNETKTAFFNYVTGKTANYNRIYRNYAGYPAQSFISRYEQTKNTSDDTLILQNDPGMLIDIRVPHISSLPVASIIKAEIVITQISSGVAADSLQVPNRLTPVGIDESGNEYEIADFNATDLTAAVVFVDGSKRTEKDAAGKDITTYRINIPRELQKAIIEKRKELHLRIRGAKGFPAAYRLVAGGRGHSTYKTQLNIVYSKPN